MQLEEQFRAEFDIVSHLRRTIRIRQRKHMIIKTCIVTASAILLYMVIDYGTLYIIDLFG